MNKINLQPQLQQQDNQLSKLIHKKLNACEEKMEKTEHQFLEKLKQACELHEANPFRLMIEVQKISTNMLSRMNKLHIQYTTLFVLSPDDSK